MLNSRPATRTRRRNEKSRRFRAHALVREGHQAKYVDIHVVVRNLGCHDRELAELREMPKRLMPGAIGAATREG